MIMGICLTKRIGTLFCALVSLSYSTAALAQAHVCGITSNQVVATALYDPFNPVAPSALAIQLRINRIVVAGSNANNGLKTTNVNFVLRGANTATNGTTVTAGNLVSSGVNFYGTGQNIFHNPSDGFVVPSSAINTPTGYARVEFSGGNQDSDFAIVNFTVGLPANLNLSASASLDFDVEYFCTGNGPGGNFNSTGVYRGALRFPIRVLSGLQASYSGGSLDFGEVGDKTTLGVIAAPATYTKVGNVNVRSSGPYRIAMSSQNNYRLTFPGGTLPGTGTGGHVLLYEASFAGRVVNNSSPTFSPVVCQRAGLNTRQMPLRVVLKEGGQTKTPSPDYGDVLTITITPLVAGSAGNSAACPQP